MNALYKTIASVIIMSNFINPLAYAAAHTHTSTKEIKTKEINPYSYAVQKILQEINQSADYLGIKWVKGGVESASKYNLSIFSVLSETSKNVIFTQGRFDYSKEIGKTLNIGFGSRQLFTVVPQLKDILGGDEIMLGANVFFDSKSANKGLFSSAHRRYSVGLELQAPKYDFYGNIYRGQSDFINNERVLSGYDFGVVANIPMIPNAKVSVSRYDFSSDVTEKTGNKFRAEYYVNAGLSFSGEYDKSDQKNSSSKLFMNFTHHFGNNSDDKTYTANTVKVWDKRYNEVKRINEVYVEKRLKQIIEIENPTAVEWGTPFNVADLVTGVKGGAKVTYSILDGGNTGARINEAGVISGTTQRGTVKAKISIAATNKYAATSREIDVEFIAKDAADLEHGIADKTSQWGKPTPTVVHSITPWSQGTHGAITYSILDADNTGASINDETTGVISGTTDVGEVTVTVAIAGGTKYKQGDVGTFTVKFIAKASTSAGEHGIVNQAGVKWGTPSTAPAPAIPSWAAETHGDIFFKISSHGTTGGNATINPNTGVISGTTHVGVVTVTVAIKGGTKYAAGDIGTFDVTFTVKAALALDFTNPPAVKLNTQSSAPASPTGYDETTMGAIKYSITSDSAGTNLDDEGRVTATNQGDVVVTATTLGGTKYNAGVIGTYTVTFTGKAALTLIFEDQPWERWNEQSDAPAIPEEYDAKKMGAITYSVTGGTASGGATIEADGSVKVTEPGKVVVTATITGGTEHDAGEIGTYTIIFGKALLPDSDVMNALLNGGSAQVGQPWTPDTAAMAVLAEYGKLSFELEYDHTNSDYVVVNPSTGVISGVENPGIVEVDYTTGGNDKYFSGYIGSSFAVLFTETQISFTPPSSVKVGIQSAAPTMTGSYDGDMYDPAQYKVTGGTALDGARVDGDGKVTATKAGTVVVVVTATTFDEMVYNQTITLGSYIVTVTD